MKIFNYDPQIQNLDQYADNIKNSPNISGIFINVIFNTEFDLNVYLPDINTFIPLEEFLNKFRDSDKTIIINMLLAYQLVSDQNSLEIANYNRNFVDQTTKLISKYPNVFYLASINTSTLFFLRSQPHLYKIGTVVTRADLGFIDVDFYVFSEYFINVEYLETLLNMKKEIFVFPDSSDLVAQLPDNIKNRLNYIVQRPV